MHTQQYEALIKFMVTKVPKRPQLVYGPSGLGKSEIPEQVAKSMGLPFVLLDGTDMEPTDLLGLPSVTEKATRYKPPEILMPLTEKPAGIFVLDEITRLDLQVRHALMPILVRREIGDLKVQDGWHIILTANPADEGFQVQELDIALVRRNIVMGLSFNIETWRKWASNDAGVAGRVVTAAGRFTSALNKGVDHPIVQTPTPYGLQVCSDLIKAGIQEELKDPDLVYQVLAGTVGDEVAQGIIADLNDKHLTELLEKALAGSKDIKGKHDILISLVYLFWEHIQKNVKKYTKEVKNLYDQLPNDIKMLLIKQIYEKMIQYPDDFSDIIEEWSKWCTAQLKALQEEETKQRKRGV